MVGGCEPEREGGVSDGGRRRGTCRKRERELVMGEEDEEGREGGT